MLPAQELKLGHPRACTACSSAFLGSGPPPPHQSSHTRRPHLLPACGPDPMVQVRVGIFSLRDILPGEELTYDYQFQHFGLAAAAGAYRCKCGAPNCRGTMDTQPERMRVGCWSGGVGWLVCGGKWDSGLFSQLGPACKGKCLWIVEVSEL